MSRHWDLGRDQGKLKKERNTSQHQLVRRDHISSRDKNLGRSQSELSEMQ